MVFQAPGQGLGQGTFANKDDIRLATASHAGLLAKGDYTKIQNLWTPDNASGTQTFTDFNAVTKSGFYNGNNPANAPYSGPWWFLLHTEHINLNGYHQQVAGPFVASTHQLYVRWAEGGTWTAWAVVYEDTGWVDATPYFVAPFSSWSGWPVRFRRLSGVVHFDGMVTTSSTVTAGGTRILNLPAGYGSGSQRMCRGAASGDPGLFVISGTAVNTQTTFTAANWVSLSDVHYPVG